MGWIEFSVVVGCGLLGFIVVSAVIESRRKKKERATESDRHKEGETAREDEQANRAKEDRQRQADRKKESRPHPWWETLNVDRNATPEQIKEAFRREISKYHPDRVEGLGIELRELADQKAKEVNHAYTLAKEQQRFR